LYVSLHLLYFVYCHVNVDGRKKHIEGVMITVAAPVQERS